VTGPVRRFLSSHGFTLGVAAILGVVLVLYTSLGYSPTGMDAAARLRGPRPLHLFGTDQLGTDVFVRTLAGTVPTFFLAFAAVLVAAAIGIPLGFVSGYFRGGLDTAVNLFVSVLSSVPQFLLILLVVAVWRADLLAMALAVGVTSVPIVVRNVRAKVLALSNERYVVNARTLGMGHAVVMFRYLFPNMLPSIGVIVLNRLIFVILLQASLDYLGLVPQTEWSTWGGMISAGKQFILNDPAGGWWVPVFPGLAIVATILLLDRFVRRAA
jgi:peptide/nickel transport system permease protein